MQLKSKNTIINIITFLFHLVISLPLLAGGYISRNPLFGVRPNQEELIIGNIAIISSLILFVASIFMLYRKNFKTYIISVLIAIISMVGWIIIEESMDGQLFLFIYLIIFLPLSFYKYKLNKKY